MNRSDRSPLNRSDKVRHAPGDAAASAPGTGSDTAPSGDWLAEATRPAAGDTGGPPAEGVPVSTRVRGRGAPGRAVESKRGAR